MRPHVQSAAPAAQKAKAIGASPGRQALEKEGVNVGGQW
jgi:hypothetical protein